MTKTTPLDIEPAIAARNEAIAAVEGASDVIVLHELRTALRAIAGRMRSFTTDDLTEAAKLTPREPKLLGAVVKWGEMAGICAPTGRYIRSRNHACHGRPKMIWRSRIYKGTL